MTFAPRARVERATYCSVSDRVATAALGVAHVAVTVAVDAGCSEEAFPRRAQTDAVPGQPGEAPT
jgi:hypothetical protein